MTEGETELGQQPEQPKAQALAITKRERKPPESTSFKFEVPKIRYKDVIGMRRPKAILHKNLELPLTKPEHFDKLDIRKSVGIIMYGPPGTGKTFLTKAVAGELNIKMCYAESSSIVSKYVGESAKKVHELFQVARKQMPCMVFIDEADILLQERDHISDEGGNQELKQAVSQMLTETSEIHDDKKACVFMLAATNKPWNVDMANKRSGRFEYMLFISLPNFWDRRKLFKLYLGKERLGVPELFGTINYTMLSLATLDYSPADIEKICKIAKLNAIEKKVVLVTTRSVQKALWSKEGGKSSADDWYLQMYYTYLPKRKSLLRSMISKRYREKEQEKRKFNKADEEFYKDLIKDVNRHHRLKWAISIARIFGRGFPIVYS